MSVLHYLPAILRLFLVFALLLILIRKGLSLGNVFLIGAFLGSLLFNLEFEAMLRSMVASIVYPKTLSLNIIVALILILSNSMNVSGQMNRLLTTFEGMFINPRINLIVFPALIGFLPMPGGAVFSAPMVKELGIRGRQTPEQLSFINYWFRHIWEYWWPLYPGVLLTVALADLNLWIFSILMCPFTIIALCLGYMSIKSYDKCEGSNNKQRRPHLGPFIWEMSPILIVIFIGLGIGIILSFAYPLLEIAREIGLILALIISIVWVLYTNDIPRFKIRQIVNRPILNIVYMIFSIVIFEGIIEDSHAVVAISRELAGLHIPLILIVMALPFMVGLVAGITIAFVGSTFPILIALIHSLGDTQYMLAYMMLAYASGYSGVLLSPLHLCLVLTSEYFDALLGAIYRYLWLPCGGILAFSIVYFWILHWFTQMI